MPPDIAIAIRPMSASTTRSSIREYPACGCARMISGARLPLKEHQPFDRDRARTAVLVPKYAELDPQRPQRGRGKLGRRRTLFRDHVDAPAKACARDCPLERRL